jgi:hypothetical protein
MERILVYDGEYRFCTGQAAILARLLRPCALESFREPGVLEESSVGWGAFFVVWGLVVIGGVDPSDKPHRQDAPDPRDARGDRRRACLRICPYSSDRLLAVGYALIDEWSGRLP